NLSRSQTGKVDKELKTGALLINFIYWILAYSFSETLKGFEAYNHFYPLKSKTIENAIFGDTIGNCVLNSAISNILPSILIQYFDNKGPNIGELKDIFSIKSSPTSSLTSNWLSTSSGKLFFTYKITESIFQYYYPRKSVKSILICCSQFKLSQQKVLQSLNDSILEISATYPQVRMNPALCHLLLPSRAPHKLPKETKNTPKSVKRKASKPSVVTTHDKPSDNSAKKPKSYSSRPAYDMNKVIKFATDISKSPSDFGPMSALIKLWTEFAHQELYIDRIIFAMIDRKTQKASAFYALGCDNNSTLKRFQVDFEKALSLKQFYEKASFAKFSIEKHQRFWPKLPQCIQEDEFIKEFLLNSINLGQQPRALIYADNTTNAWKLDEKVIVDYRKTIKALAIALTFLQKEKKRRLNSRLG
ncbi:MAG: hypothetical protein AAGB12_07710, partial [Pseudomonadota bacterium]